MRRLLFLLTITLIFYPLDQERDGLTLRRIKSTTFSQTTDEVIEFFARPELAEHRVITQGKSSDEIVKDIIGRILGIPLFEEISGEVLGLINPKYIPGVVLLGELKDRDPVFYLEKKNYLLEEISRQMLINYKFQELVNDEKNRPIIDALWDDVDQMELDAVKKELLQRLGEGMRKYIISWNEETAKKRLWYERIKFGIGSWPGFMPQAEEYARQHLIATSEIIRMVFEWKPSTLEEELGRSPNWQFLDYLTTAQAEKVVRRIIKIILFNNPFYEYDFDRFWNKEQNRIVYYVVEELADAMQEAELRMKEEGLSSETINRQKLLTLALYAIAGNVIDIGISEIGTVTESGMHDFLIGQFSKVSSEDLSISSFDKFYREIIQSQKKVKLLYFLDNHGEVIFDLFFIQEMLRQNPNLNVVIVPKSTYVANDVSYVSLEDIMRYDVSRERPLFDRLRDLMAVPFDTWEEGDRVIVLAQGSDFQGIDLRFMDERLVKEMNDGGFSKIVCIFKGNANFFTTQGLNLDRYYFMMVKFREAEGATGLIIKDRGKYPSILGFIEPGVIVGRGPFNPLHPPPEGVIPIAPYTFMDYALEHPDYFDKLP